MDAAGFYICLPIALEQEIRLASSVVLTIHATALTRTSQPTRVHATTLFGQKPWSEYRALHPGARADSAPRLRALSLVVKDLGCCAFDLDAMAKEDRSRLLDAAIRYKLVIGHNLVHDFSGCSAREARPASLVDLLLIVQHLAPKALLRPFARAASADPVRSTAAAQWLRSCKGKPNLTLDSIAACLELPVTNSSFASTTSWSVTKLAREHRDYCGERLTLLAQIFSRFFPSGPDATTAEEIVRSMPVYGAYANATVRLAEAHVRGVPFDSQAAEDLRTSVHLAEGCGGADPLNSIPVPRSGDAGLEANQIAHLRTYQARAQNDGRLHSLVTFGTVTGRTLSREPALQNLPRNPRWRGLIRARAGYQILSVDYVAIELRIAAALASRAVSDICRRVKAKEDDWFLTLVRIGRQKEAPLEWPPDPGKRDLNLYRDLVLACSQRVFRHRHEFLKSALQAGLDPHLVTALEFARRLRQIQFEGSALDWLAQRNASERAQLKDVFGEQRQAAKVRNFGLLYGMTTYGLHATGIKQYGLRWTLEEAAATRDSWFELYPEITLWHLWTRYCQRRKVAAHKIMCWEDRRQNLRTPKYPVCLYETTTLAGRPLAVLEDRERAISYQGQGTGADILALAISSLPAEIADMLLMPVHDELVFEVPQAELDRIRLLVESAMISAGRAALGTDIPVEVESSAGDTWG